MKRDYRILPSGDSLALVEFEERVDPIVNARAIALSHSIAARALKGIRDIVPTYRTVAVHFDPLKTDVAGLFRYLDQEAAQSLPGVPATGETIRIPVCYGGAYGPDLESVAAFAKASVDEVVLLHTAVRYRVFMLGFVPGFAYLGSVDPRIASPRRETPRVRVPRGSVGIAGEQTGVYPQETPGGWQLIGRTPVALFDASRSDPFLLEPGDHVEFYAIAAAEFEASARPTQEDAA
jgi:KipI family sensor histidine kinase inhibitor